MTVLKLRSHVPISAPHRREAADGTESALRLSPGFNPKWYHKRCGVDFSERWHRDPYYRYETMKKMREELINSFPEIPYWNEEYREGFSTISGIDGIYLIARIFGFSLVYKEDMWPDLDKSNQRLSKKEIEKIDIEELLSGPVVEELFKQMDVMESEWGKIYGYINWQGVINIAFHLRGEQIFVDIVEDPDFVHYFFSIICELLIKLSSKVQKRQRESGVNVNHFVVSNCVVNMISPEMYEKFVFPTDKRIAESDFERFGIHTCDWDATPYFEQLRKLPRLGYLDMGMMSDLKRAKGLFPEVRRAVFYSEDKLEKADISEIRKDLEKIHIEYAPCDVVIPSIEPSTPDNRVKEVYEICTEIAERD